MRLLWRIPELAAREIAHHDIRVGAFQLLKRRNELVSVARAKRRGLLIDEDRPIRVAGRHLSDCRK